MESIKAGKRPGNPLRKRVWRDLLRDWKRYFMIFAVFVVTVGFVSGMYVANHSMMTSLDSNAEKFNRADGRFELSGIADEALLEAVSTGEKADVVGAVRRRAYDEAEEEIEKALRDSFPEEAWGTEAYEEALSQARDEAHAEIDKTIDEEYAQIAERYELDESFDPVPVSISELLYKNVPEGISEDEGYDGTIRVYAPRTETDLYDILSGRAPENDDEIIIDRMHAENAGISVGDRITADGADFEVVGLVSFTDYICLYENNSDTMFDALTFDVGMVTDEGFERISAPLHANYAFSYKNEPSDLYEEKEFSDHFMKALITQNAASDQELEIKDYVPAYADHAITFASEDMGSDMAMGGVLLYILTAVLAFIFAVSISSSLEKEASVIGTLRASGYTKGEILRYYMSAPLIVVVLASAVGNVLGYTLFKNIIVDMYYNSYSLPAYKTLWTSEAFIRTTAVPFVLMLVINFIVIIRTLRLSPLRFLRHDLKRKRRSKAIRLPRWSFFRRFRLRILLQNIPDYLMLFAGITFVMLLLSMAVGLPSTLSYYQEKMPGMMFAEEQLILSGSEDDNGDRITTDTPGAEPFSMYSLEYRTDKFNEEIAVYGITEGSSYIALKKTDAPDSMWISSAFSAKYGIEEGDSFTLCEKYEKRQYDWKVAGVYDYDGALAVFMPNSRFNEVFDKSEDSFSGFISDTPITDIDEKYIVKRITSDDMVKIADQLDHSMGSYMVYFQYVCLIVAAIILYLLTKMIIEKNERSIAMVKILGYNDKEIALLYLVTTAVVVVITEFAAMALGYLLMKVFWSVMLETLGGYFAFIMKPGGFVREFIIVTAAYLFITALDVLRIKRIPKVLALKNVE